MIIRIKLVFLTFLVYTALRAQDISVIPQPVQVTKTKSFSVIREPVGFIWVGAVETDVSVAEFKSYLTKFYKLKDFRQGDTHSYGFPFEVHFLTLDETQPDGYYVLEVKDGRAYIKANEKGVFYAFQTLKQLISVNSKKQIVIPNCKIIDYPRFQYRGMHLDVSRHFFPVSFIKKYIDYLALHKLNRFHWHLTDDQGWRIEIKKYPKLTSIGSKRNGTLIGRYPGKGSNQIPEEGYYTQQQIREVVKYAQDRYIDVIPEIDVPAHSSAAIAAYPALSCFPGKTTEWPTNMMSDKSIEEQKQGKTKLVQETWGTFDDVLCAGNDSTFLFLQNVLNEVLPLFPSKYFHAGGDECLKTHWKICPKCQQRMKTENLKDEHELQSYFMERVEKLLNRKGKTMIGWDEILEGGIAPNAVIMSWQGIKGGIAAAKQKHYAIMSPGNPLYFDHTQSANEDSITFGGFNPIENVYAYEPIPAELNASEGKYILGAQANLWTEYILNTGKIEYQLFPRIAALSEVVWSPKEKKNWNDFEKRLQKQFQRYDLWKINYSRAYFDLKSSIIPGTDKKSVIWKLESRYNRSSCENCYIQAKVESRYKDLTVIYDTVPRIDPKYPDANYSQFIVTKNTYQPGDTSSRNFQDESILLIPVRTITSASAAQYFYQKRGALFSQNFTFNKATGKNITLATPASDKYPGDGPFTLVNAAIGEKGFARSKEFLGFSGTDCEAVIDLDSLQEISFVVVNSLERTNSWIWRPKAAEILGSSDGEKWYPLGQTTTFQEKNDGTGKGMMTVAFRKTFARYVKSDSKKPWNN